MKLVIRVAKGLFVSGVLMGLAAMSCATGAEATGGQGGSSGQGQGGQLFTTSSADGAGGIDIGIDAGSGCPATVSGTVFDPSGKLPLYNVVVYVPSQPLDPVPEGAACETCDGNFSGKPIAAALSDAAGKFKMDISKVSLTKDVPLVIQVGKWRREVTIPSINACSDTPVDTSLTRLPRNKAEGNIPQIAMVRGGSDALECLIRKLGVDDAEFTTDDKDGRVHLYYIPGGTATSGTAQMKGGAPIAKVDTLYSDLNKMKKYDLIMMACPGSDNIVGGSPLPEFVNVRTYADQGGRVFGSHYNADWIWSEEFTPNNPYPDVVKFSGSAHGFSNGFVATGNIDTSFPKGQAMSDWLTNVGASMVPGQIPILGGEHTVDAVTHMNAEAWITTTDDKGHQGVVEYFSFPTPIDGKICGRMVFSDLHVSSGTGDSGKVAFPDGCISSTLSPQEKALAFMFFDLASCVQPEDGPVEPPVIK